MSVTALASGEALAGQGRIAPLADVESLEARATTTIDSALQLASLSNPQAAIRDLEGLLRRGGLGPHQWRVRSLLAMCLFDAAFKTIDRLGVQGRQASVSPTRIGLFKAATAQLDSAEAATSSPVALGHLRAQRAKILEVCGFTLDAHGWYRAAATVDPGNLRALVGLARTLDLLRNADRTPAPDGNE